MAARETPIFLMKPSYRTKSPCTSREPREKKKEIKKNTLLQAGDG